MSNNERETPELSTLEKELVKESTSVQPRGTFWQSLGDFYFKPKSFEKSGKIYEMLDVPCSVNIG